MILNENDRDVIVLFSGCGGFSKGFKQAGFNIIYANDNWKVALESHKLNYPACKHLCENIKKLKDFPSAPIVIGSPPCSCFSQANISRNKNMKEQEKNGLELVYEFERVVDIVQPKLWLWENVPSVSKYYNNGFYLNSRDVGLPQYRNRYFVGNFTYFLEKTEPHTYTPNYRYDGSSKPISSKTQQRHSGYARTVTTHRISDIEKGEFISIEKVKELMGFPLEYKLFGGISSQQKQLGNAVCPPVAKAIAKAIINNKVESNNIKSIFDF